MSDLTTAPGFREVEELQREHLNAIVTASALLITVPLVILSLVATRGTGNSLFLGPASVVMFMPSALFAGSIAIAVYGQRQYKQIRLDYFMMNVLPTMPEDQQSYFLRRFGFNSYEKMLEYLKRPAEGRGFSVQLEDGAITLFVVAVIFLIISMGIAVSRLYAAG